MRAWPGTLGAADRGAPGCRYLEASDPLRSGTLKVVVNASHPEHGAYFNASLVASLSAQPHNRNEFATLGTLLRCAPVAS